MIVYTENGNLRIGSLVFKVNEINANEKESITIKDFHFSGDYITQYGTVSREFSENPKLTIEQTSFSSRKYSLCG